MFMCTVMQPALCGYKKLQKFAKLRYTKLAISLQSDYISWAHSENVYLMIIAFDCETPGTEEIQFAIEIRRVFNHSLNIPLLI